MPAPRPTCARCGAPMAFDGGYPRWVREAGKCYSVFVRRARCRGCGIGESLLADFVLARRRDSTAAVGACRPGVRWCRAGGGLHLPLPGCPRADRQVVAAALRRTCQGAVQVLRGTGGRQGCFGATGTPGRGARPAGRSCYRAVLAGGTPPYRRGPPGLVPRQRRGRQWPPDGPRGLAVASPLPPHPPLACPLSWLLRRRHGALACVRQLPFAITTGGTVAGTTRALEARALRPPP